MPDVNVTIGADSSAFTAGLASIRNETQRVGTSLQQSLTGLFSPATLASAALTVGLKTVIEAAHGINHEAERFGVDAEQLQLIANAAKEDGISLEATARALNQLTINAQKGLDPVSEQAKALHQLGIDATYFSQLNADEKFLNLSNAYAASAHTGADYAAVATLIGKRNTELIPILDKGSAAIREQGKAMGIVSRDTVKNLDEMYKSLKIAGSQFQVLGAEGVGALRKIDDFLKSIIDKLKGAASLSKIADALAGRSGPSGPRGANIGTNEQSQLRAAEQYLEISKEELDVLQKENDVRLAGVSHEQKLAELATARATLETELAAEITNESDHTERALELRGQIADITKAILPLEAELSQEKSRQADLDAQGVERADKSIQQSKDKVAVENLMIQGRTEEARLLEIELTYNEKIKEALANANKARQDGLEQTAQENELLAKQLEIEKQTEEAQVKQEVTQKRNLDIEKQIRDAAGALLFYNLRIGDAAKNQFFTTTGQDVLHGGGTLLTGDAKKTWDYISSLEDKLFASNNPTEQANLLNQINALIPLLEQQLGILQSINKNVTPAPGT